RGGRPAVACHAPGLPGGVSVPKRTTTEWIRGGRGGRLRTGTVHASVCVESRRAADTVSQHGADVASDDRGGCRPAHERVPRGSENALLGEPSRCRRRLLTGQRPLLFFLQRRHAPAYPMGVQALSAPEVEVHWRMT